MGRNSGGVHGSGGGSYSQSQIENAIYDYVNGNSSEINGWLRSPGSYVLSPDNIANMRILDSVLTAPITNDVLYRKTEAKSIFGYLSQSDYDKLYMHVVEGVPNGGVKKHDRKSDWKNIHRERLYEHIKKCLYFGGSGFCR